MLTRRRAIVAQASLVIGVVIPLGCSTFGEDAATDGGSTSTSEGGEGGATDASLDRQEQQPDTSVPELCEGAGCPVTICGLGETTSSYPVTVLLDSQPSAGGNCTTFGGGAPESVLDDSDGASDQGLSEIRCSMPQRLILAHAPFDDVKGVYRLVVRAWVMREGVEPLGKGMVLGAVKGVSFSAPVDKSPIRPTSMGWGVVSYVVDHVPGTSLPFGTKADGDGVTILLDIQPATSGTIHVSRAWIEVCRPKKQ